MPRPERLSPPVALEAIATVFLSRGEVVALSADGQLALLGTLAGRGLAGGRTYDALIAATAREAGADELLTFNVRHFTGLEDSLRVVLPVDAT